MANALALGASAARLVGSSPTPSTHLVTGSNLWYRVITKSTIKNLSSLFMGRMPQEQIESSRENYDKRAEEIANPSLGKRLSKFFETADFSELQGRGIAKEDVIRIDAELESEARKAAEGKGADSEEQKYLDRMLNSDLVFNQTVRSIRAGIYPWRTDIIKGEIKGQDVNVQNEYFLGLNELHVGGDGKTREKESYKGSINGKEMFEPDARNIYDEYGPIAKKRIIAVNQFLREKKEAEQNTQIQANTGDSLEKIK